MLELKEQKLKKKSKIQNINCGVSTKNFIATQSLQKKWLKVKQTNINHRQLQETYCFNAILDPLMRKQNRSSLISLRDISINIEAKKEDEKGVVLFYLERPYASMTLIDMLGRNFKDEMSHFTQQIGQIFLIFLENALLQLPLLIPSNFLYNKLWGQHFSLDFNYTSLVGFQLFIQQVEIFTSKFKQFSAYLHPNILGEPTQPTKSPNIRFQTKLYSFALIILTLILKKPFSIPCSFERYQNTITVGQIKEILKNNHNEILTSLEKKIVWDQIKQKLKQTKLSSSLLKFIKKAIFYQSKGSSKEQNKNYFRCWKDVISHFDPDLLSQYIQFLTKKSADYDYLIKELYKSENEQTKKIYKNMGVIDPRQGTNFEDVKELAIYFMLKVDGFGFVNNVFGSSQKKMNHYQPKKYSTLKKLVLESRTLQQQQQPQSKQSNTNKVLDEKQEYLANLKFKESNPHFQKETLESLNFNVFSFQLHTGQPQNPVSTIYVPNEFQKTLDIYGSRLWP